MQFQFCCPQGHVLQGDESRVGQPCQCPYCGQMFLVPPPGQMPATAAPSATAPAGGEMPLPTFQPPGLPAGPRPQFELPPAQPVPMQMASGEAAPTAPASSGEESSGLALPFDLGEPAPLPFDLPESGMPISRGGVTMTLPFDPTARDPLPFEMPGAEASELPLATEPIGGGEASPLQSVEDAQAPLPEEPGQIPQDAGKMPLSDLVGSRGAKKFHIPCPAGHPLEVTSKMLGRTVRCPLCGSKFRLRYEDSIEARRRKAVERQRRDEKVGLVWLAWAITAAIVVLITIVVLAFSIGH